MKPLQDYQKEIKNLAKVIPGWYKINNHERQTCLNNAVIKLLEKFNQGKVPCDNYEEYKGYMFLTIRNQIFRIFERQKGKKVKMIVYGLDLISASYQDKNGESDQIKKRLINELPPKDKALIRFLYWRKWTRPYMASVLGVTLKVIDFRLQKIKRLLKKQYKELNNLS